ncbi:hypothetical protein SUDANB1_03256 [Streptomyces sp. enrichment culture]
MPGMGMRSGNQVIRWGVRHRAPPTGQTTGLSRLPF